jgi:hypothetical protein
MESINGCHASGCQQIGSTDHGGSLWLPAVGMTDDGHEHLHGSRVAEMVISREKKNQSIISKTKIEIDLMANISWNDSPSWKSC